MQMIFSGAGIGGSQVIASSAWSGAHRTASSASFVSAPAAIASRSVGYSLPKRAERSTTPPSTTAPYLVDPSTEKVAMRCEAMNRPITGSREVSSRLQGAGCLAGIHALGFDDSSGGGSSEKGDECFGGFCVIAVRSGGGGEDQFLRQRSGEGAGQFDAGSDQHVDEKHSELGFPLGACRSDLGRRRLRLGLGLYRLADAEPVERLQDVAASGALRHEGNGLRVEQRLFQRVRRTYVGLRSAGPNNDAVADAGDIDGRPGDEAGLRGGVLENIDRHHSQVEWCTRCGLLDQVGSGIEVNDELMAGGALELRAKFVQRTGHGAASQNLQFSGLKISHRRHDQRKASIDAAVMSESFFIIPPFDRSD